MNANSKQLHSGSTILGLDLNNDGAKELILGDVSHANLVMLTNGGTPDEAEMTNVDNSFPGEDVPVNLPVFPAAFYLDVNNDGKKDLIAAVNERNNAISANHVSGGIKIQAMPRSRSLPTKPTISCWII